MTKLKQTITMCIAFLLCTISLSVFATEINVTPADNLADSVAKATDGDIFLLADGTYKMTKGLRIEKEITLKGESNDSSKVIIDVGNTVENSGHGVHIVKNNVTLENLTVKSTHLTTFTLRVGYLDGNAKEDKRTKGVNLKDITVIGGKSVVLHGTDGALVDGILVKEQTARGVSIAITSSTVSIKNTTTIGGAWGDIGVMWENSEDKPWYTKPIEVTLGENNHFTVGVIYSEKYSDLGNAFVTKPFGVEGFLNQIDQMMYTIHPYSYIVRPDTSYMYTSIAGAMNDAKSGETINLTAGTFKEAFAIKDGVNVKGKDSTLTIIEGPKNIANTVTLGVGSSLKNVTVTRAGNTASEWVGNAASQGVQFNQGDRGNATLENCIITKNRNGVYANNARNIIIKNNIIKSNRTGIQIANGCEFEITGNKITDNLTIGLLCQYLSASNNMEGSRVFTGNTVTGNWYSQVENRWLAPHSLDLSNNDYGTDVLTYTYASSSGEPAYTDQIPQWAGGIAVAPESAPTFVFPSKNETTLPDGTEFKIFPNIFKILVSNSKNEIKGVFTTLMPALALADDGDTIMVYPGVYETGVMNSKVWMKDANGDVSESGAQNFNMIIRKPITLMGVDTDGNAITDASKVLATIKASKGYDEGTNIQYPSFGTSTIYVDTANITLQGLRIATDGKWGNKLIEVSADNVIINACDLDASFIDEDKVLANGAVYVGENAGLINISTITKNIANGSISVNNGAQGGVITDNTINNAYIAIAGKTDAIAWFNMDVDFSKLVITGNMIKLDGAKDSRLFSVAGDNIADPVKGIPVGFVEKFISENTLIPGSAYVTTDTGAYRAEIKINGTQTYPRFAVLGDLNNPMAIANANDIINIKGVINAGNFTISKPVTIDGIDSGRSTIEGYINVNSNNVTIQNVAMQFTDINDQVSGRAMVRIPTGKEDVTLKNINFLQHSFAKINTAEAQAKAIYTGVGVGFNVIGCTIPMGVDSNGYERAMWNDGFKTVAGKRWQIRDNNWGPNSNIDAASKSFDIIGNKLDSGLTFGPGVYSDFVIENNILGKDVNQAFSFLYANLDSYRFENNTIAGIIYGKEDVLVNIAKNYWNGEQPRIYAKDLSEVKMNKIQTYPVYTDSTMTTLSFEGAKIIIGDKDGMKRGYSSDDAQYVVGTTKENDTVTLGASTFNGFNVTQKGVSVIGSEDGKSIIMAGKAYNGASIVCLSNERVSLKNVSVRAINSADNATAIFAYATKDSIIIDNCNMEDTNLYQGIYSEGDNKTFATLLIKNCTIGVGRKNILMAIRGGVSLIGNIFKGADFSIGYGLGGHTVEDNTFIDCINKTQKGVNVKRNKFFRTTETEHVWEKRPADATGVIDASKNYWGAQVPDFASLILDYTNTTTETLSVNPFPYYEDEAMTILSYKGAKIIITDANGNEVGGFADIPSAVSAAKDGDVIGLGEGTYSNNLTIDKSISIVGLSSDSSLVKLTGLINIPDSVNGVGRRVINLKNLSIASVPVDGSGMIDITGSNIDLNIDNVGMVNTSAGVSNPKYGIMTNGVNTDSVLINFMNSSIEGKGKNQRAIVTKDGQNHRINVINSYIFSSHGKDFSAIYGVSTASLNSELYIDNSTINVSSYAACLRNGANQKMTIKNSTLTGWAAIYVEGVFTTKIPVESPVVRIDNCTLNQRSYWSGISNDFGAVVIQGSTNVDAIIHNTTIKQELANVGQKVIHLSDEYYTTKISGKLALTGTTTLIRNSDADSNLFKNPIPSQFTVTVDPTVSFLSADGKPVIEVATAMVETGKTKTLLTVTTSMINAFAISNANENSVIYGNSTQTPAEIAAEVNANPTPVAYTNILMINGTQYIAQKLDSALTFFNEGKNATWFDFANNSFVAKTVRKADLNWNKLPATIVYNTSFADPALTTSGQPITYSVEPNEAATIAGTTITPLSTGKLVATIESKDEVIGNKSTVDMVVHAKKLASANIIVTGIDNEIPFTGMNVTTGFTLAVSAQDGTAIPLFVDTDYTVRYNVKGGAEVAPINVGTYVMTLELKGNRYAYADLNDKFQKEFKITSKTTEVADVSIVTPRSITYGTALKDVAISCDNTKGTVAWKTPATVLTAGKQTPEWIFTSTNANYSSFEGTASIEVAKRPVLVVVTDTAIAQGNAYIDSSYSFVNYIDNSVDTVKNIVLATDYAVDSVLGDVATIYVDDATAEKTETNQTFTFVDGKLLVGEPTLDLYTFEITPVAYGSKLNNFVITTKTGKGFVRWVAGQDNLMPTVAGIDVKIEYVLYGKVAETKTIKVSATKKAATLTIDNQSVIVRDAIPALTASVLGVIDGESLDYTLSTTYRSDIMNAGTYPITATIGTNVNYAVTVVAGNVTSTQIEMTNIAVAPFTTTYNGNIQTPIFTIKDGSRTLSLNDDYTMENASKKDVGQLEVVITFKGRYTGVTKAIFTVSVAKLTATLDVASNPYSGVVHAPAFNFKQVDGVVVTFVTPADYIIVEATNATIQNAGNYSVSVTTQTPNIELTSTAATYTISKLQAAFNVINKLQTFEEENYSSKQYTAKVTSALPLMKSEDFDVTYGGTSFETGTSFVTDSGIFQIWAKVKGANPNFNWDSTNISLGKLEVKDLQIAEVFFTELSGVAKEIQKEVIESGAGFADSIIITAQAVGPIGDDVMTVGLNISGMAKKGVNFIFENDKESFEFTRTKKTDTIRVIILDDSVITGDLTAKLDLNSSNPAMLVRSKQANFTLTINTLKNVVAVAQIGFEKKEIEASTAVSEYPFAVIGKEGVTAYIKVSGAVLGKDVQIRDINKNIVDPTSAGCPVYIDGANIGIFTLENINNDLVKVDAKKVITLTISKATTTSSEIVVIERAKRSVKLILTNTSPVAFSDEFAYEANEAIDNEDVGSFLLLNVLRNDMPYGDVSTSALYVRGVRKIGESTFKSSITDDFNGTVVLTNDGNLLYTFNKDAITVGYVAKFEYELAQKDAGLSIGTVALTLAPSVVRGESISVKLPESTNNNKPVLSGEYIDPFSAKASAQNKVKKILLKVTKPKAGELSDSVIVQINANLKGYDNRVLSTARKNGRFLSSMYNKDSELFFTINTAGNFKAANKMGGRTVQVNDTVEKLLQVRKMGISIKAKSTDSSLTEVTFSPALNTRLADTVITNGNNELFAPIYLCYSRDEKGRIVGGKKAITLQGDFFGPKAKFYFEYFDGKKIKKVTLSSKRSIIVYTKENIRYILKRTSVVSGKNQQEWLIWPTSLEKLINSGRAVDGRFDLIIDNGSMLNSIPNFDVKRIIDYKAADYK